MTTRGSEVKGLWFVTARRYVVETFGEDGLRAVLGELVGAARSALEDPLPSAWYPEHAMQESLAAARTVLAGNDPDRMLAILEGCTLIGIHAFWRTALRVTAPSFALRALPVSWRHLRRGRGEMAVEIDRGVARIHYRDFPYFDDSNYRLLVLGTVGPLLRLSIGVPTPVTITGWTASTLTAQTKFR